MSSMKRKNCVPPSVDVKIKRMREQVGEETKLCSCLEDLSNELFYEISEYLDAGALYRSFSNLNTRFKNLLCCSPVPLKIKLQSNSQSELQCFFREVIVPNRHRIISLSLLKKSLIEQYIWYCYIDARFDRLESVTFKEITPSGLALALAYLKSLPRLSSLSIHVDEHEEGISFDDIYQLIFSFPTLRYNKLSLTTDDDEDYKLEFFVPLFINERFSRIEYLVIDHRITFNQLLSLIQHTPQLRRLTAYDLFGLHEDVRTDLPIALSQLTHISLHPGWIDLGTFERFMKQISGNLHVLRLTVIAKLEDVNAERWKWLMTTSMPCLSEFYFHIEYDLRIDHGRTNIQKLIKECTSPIWFERHWSSEIRMDRVGVWCLIRPPRRQWFECEEQMATSKNPNRNFQLASSQHSIGSSRLNVKDLSMSCSSTPCVAIDLPEISCNNQMLQSLQLTSVAARFTHLSVSCDETSIDKLMEAIRLLSNLDSLELSFSETSPLICLSAKDRQGCLSVSTKNQITKVTLTHVIHIEQIGLAVDLCPRMRYLQLDFTAEIEPRALVRFCLSRPETDVSHLRFLCLKIRKVDNDLVEDISAMICSEKLLSDYTIRCADSKIYIRWDNTVPK